MSLQTYFSLPVHQEERQEFPLLVALIERYSREKPFLGLRIVFGHLLVRNSMVVAEALSAGGAELVISEGFASPTSPPVIAELAQHEIPVLPIREAVKQGEIFFDVDAILGRQRLPQRAAEATRTGVHHYREIPCPVVSADDSRAKRIEGFYGTGEGFLQAWRLFFPDDRLEGKRLVQFGPSFENSEILGGRNVPLNFHLDQPAPSRYIDPSLAAHVLALEALVKGDYSIGIHPLPAEMDDWLLNEWQRHWPEEDLTLVSG